MDIHEYQAKKILSDFGVVIPRGGIVYSPENAENKAREIGGTKWVVKAQIHSGARGKAGGIIVCNSALEVAQATDKLLGKKLVTNQTGPEGKIVNRVYIEEAKQFAMTQDGRSITVTFPLLNTGSYEEISRNWQLLYGLVYQNRPGRITKTLVDIPVMYEAFIEGMLYMPYSYITGIKVDFLGNRRTMGINLPVVGSDGDGAGKKINTVIPDAFNVTITLRGLNDETRNFLYESITPGVVTSRAGDSEFSGEAEGELI